MKKQIKLQIRGVEGTEICVGERRSDGDFMLERKGIKRFQLITNRSYLDEDVWHDGYLIGGSRKGKHREIIEARIMIDSSVLLMDTQAPTGESEKRLNQAKRQPAQTIHRFIKEGGRSE